ncbi:hypothetical protein GCM10009624_34230 [Gordonia sinesedis]
MPEITLTVADDHLATIGQVAEAARAAGMKVTQVLDDAGIISGHAPEDCTPALRDIDGVDAVEGGRSFRAAPPDSGVQ